MALNFMHAKTNKDNCEEKNHKRFPPKNSQTAYEKIKVDLVWLNKYCKKLIKKKKKQDVTNA